MHKPVTMEQVIAKKMTVSTEYPPNISEIAKVLPGSMNYGIIFTYGDTIYNPSRINLTPELMAHEATHGCQQEEMGADDWWSVYLVSDHFRYEQELEAHTHEYMMYAATHNRHMNRVMLKLVGQKLAAELYGKLNKARGCMGAIKEKANAETKDWAQARVSEISAESNQDVLQGQA